MSQAEGFSVVIAAEDRFSDAVKRAAARLGQLPCTVCGQPIGSHSADEVAVCAAQLEEADQ